MMEVTTATGMMEKFYSFRIVAANMTLISKNKRFSQDVYSKSNEDKR